MRKLITRLLIVAILGGGFGIYWYFIRDSAPPKLGQTVRPLDKTSKAGVNGSYVAQAGESTTAGFRIAEKFGPLHHLAVVRTKAVTGGLVLKGVTVSSASISLDMTKLESIDDQPPGVFPVADRIDQMRDSGLETVSFPTATFKLTTPITLATAPTKGASTTSSATGALTIHGVTKTVTIPTTATWNGTIIDISGSLDVQLADFKLTPPTLNFVTVTNKGQLEFKIAFVKG